MSRWAALLLGIHAGLLVWLAFRYSPTVDELGHLPAGISIWRFGRFDLYRVNPPLVKGIAALPAMAVEIREDWSSFDDTTVRRPEWEVGSDFVRANGLNSFWYWTLARWACIPLSLLGGYICFRWSRESFGDRAGIVALTCWCFSPNMLAYGALVLPDMGATSLGLVSAWTFRNWLNQTDWTSAATAGVALGLAELAKLTWIILFPLYPLIWAGCAVFHCYSHHTPRSVQFRHLIAVLGIGIYVINAGYAFQGTLTPLGDHVFYSQFLTGRTETRVPGNRFWGTCLERVPVPLPRDYVSGIDLQRIDFERGKVSFLRGEQRLGGWWYYYLYSLFVKEPFPVWLLLSTSLVGSLRKTVPIVSKRDAVCLAVIPIVLLAFVSSETGFTQYMRYVLPVLPFAYIWGSRVAESTSLWGRSLTVFACAWIIVESCCCYPHSFGYCSVVAGGPRAAMWHLFRGNFDYGQNVQFLSEWIDSHPEARPLKLCVYTGFDLEAVGMQHEAIPLCRDGESLSPGWYVISAAAMQAQESHFRCFAKLTPSDVIAEAIFVYHVK